MTQEKPLLQYQGLLHFSLPVSINLYVKFISSRTLMLRNDDNLEASQLTMDGLICNILF